MAEDPGRRETSIYIHIINKKEKANKIIIITVIIIVVVVAKVSTK